MKRTEQAMEMAEKGYSLKEIAKTFGTTEEVVRTSMYLEMMKTERIAVRLFLTEKTYSLLQEEASERDIEVAGIIRSLISKHIRAQKQKKRNEGKG
jgi:predicted transcriptional regulator